LHPRGYAVLAHVSWNPRPQLPTHLIRILTQLSPRGVITTSASSPVVEQGTRELLDVLGLPAVHLAQDIPGRTCVRADNRQGMRALMAICWTTAASAPRYCSGDCPNQPDHRERDRCSGRNSPGGESGGRGPDGGRTGHESEIHPSGTRPVVPGTPGHGRRRVHNDSCALAALDTMAEAGISVPEQISSPASTTTRTPRSPGPGSPPSNQDVHGQGALAGPAAAGLVDGAEPGDHEQVACRVVPRGTTRRRGTVPGPDTAPGPTTPAGTRHRTGTRQPRHPTCRTIPPTPEEAALQAPNLSRRLRAETALRHHRASTEPELSRCWDRGTGGARGDQTPPRAGVRRCFVVTPGLVVPGNGRGPVPDAHRSRPAVLALLPPAPAPGSARAPIRGPPQRTTGWPLDYRDGVFHPGSGRGSRPTGYSGVPASGAVPGIPGVPPLACPN
jgi:hypothetical protein